MAAVVGEEGYLRVDWESVHCDGVLLKVEFEDKEWTWDIGWPSTSEDAFHFAFLLYEVNGILRPSYLKQGPDKATALLLQQENPCSA